MASPHRTRRVRTVVVALALVTAACASETGEEPTVPDTPDTTATGPQQPDATAILDAAYPDRQQPPTVLEVTDVVEGSGAAATAGRQVVVHYWGLRWSDGGTFDASWTRGEPFTFALGAGRVIAGWEQGVEGMRVGGRRLLVIPPALAYGDRGAGDVIGPGETLVFVVDLLDVAGS
mgnify:CR=1 FL=1